MKIISKLFVICSLSITSISGFAAGAPEIQSGATVTISNNKATKIRSSGGSGMLGVRIGGKPVGAQVDASGETNVNSLVVHNGGKIGGTVTIDGNKAEDVENNGGGTINVNSVVLK